MGDRLLWAVKNGDADVAKECLEKFNVNAELMNGRNAIHYAADYGQTEIVKLLVEKGADVNAPDKHGISPLLAAVYEDHAGVVRLLISCGAKKSGKAPNGLSYIECAESDDVKSLLK